MEGARLGPYQLLAELGSGGMGKVYRAEVAGPVPGLDTGCAVALKVIHAHLLETPGFFKRFLREADIGQTIEHENVVRTYDCDALLHDGTQQNFLVMEYVEGQTLRDLLKELERVPEELCRHIGREVARGLTAIHEAGAIHRDLKPENVLITPDHVVKIMDLGVARLRDESIRLSQTGAFVGSLEYAAPEQFRSADGEPDGRADLHALGVVLYELATGQHPYRDEDVGRVLAHILNDTPRKAGELNPQLSPFFEEVVHTLIAKEREARFAASSDVAVVLEEGEESAWWKARAQALRVETRRPLRRIRIPRETALYGRDDDLAWMRKAYDQTKADDGQVLLIEGEAGIGKTRLVDEFVGRLRQEGEDVNFLFGSYPPGGAATASGAFSEAYREQFGAEGLEETLRGYLTVTPLLIPCFAALLTGDAPPRDAEALTKDSLQTVFVHATRGLAAERATIVLIDDLHFAPEDGRALFASLANAVPGQRVLLVGTMRPGVPDEWTSGITRLEHAEMRTLSRLGPKDLSHLLKDAFRSERLARELGIQIAEKSDGNPFFAFEIIRGLREGQFIAQQPDGTWVTTKVIDDVQVPSSVLDLVNARVGDLTENERDLLDVASCCGFEFDPALVGEVLGLARIAVLKRFGQIERRHQLVRSAGREYRFDHHQVQEALYGSLNEQLREEYHAAIGDALEKMAPANPDAGRNEGSLRVDLCEHFLMGGLPKRALPYLDDALDHLRAGFLHAQATRLIDRVLGVPGLLQGAHRARVLLRLNRHLDRMGKRSEQEHVLDEARLLAAEAADQRLMADFEHALGKHSAMTGRYGEAEVHWTRLLDIARALEDRALESNALGLLGHVAFARAEYLDARARFDEALGLSREVDDPAGECRATGGLGNVAGALGEKEVATRYCEEELALRRDMGDRHGEAVALGNLANAFDLAERVDEARDCQQRALAIMRETGDRSGECRALSNLGAYASRHGLLADSQEFVERALDLAREIGDPYQVAHCTGLLASRMFERGRMGEAHALYGRSIELMRELGDRRSEALYLMQLAVLLHAAGRYADAHGRLEASCAMLHDVGDHRHEAFALRNLAPMRLSLGHLGPCQEALDAAGALAESHGYPELSAGLALETARLVFEENHDARALELAREATRVSRGTPRPYILAESLLFQGMLLRRAGDIESAREALTEVVALAPNTGRDSVSALARATLACLGDGDSVTTADIGASLNLKDAAPFLRFLLWQASGDRTQLAEAKLALDELLASNPEEYRESMLQNVRLHREIMEAWAEHGEKAVREGEETS